MTEKLKLKIIFWSSFGLIPWIIAAHVYDFRPILLVYISGYASGFYVSLCWSANIIKRITKS